MVHHQYLSTCNIRMTTMHVQMTYAVTQAATLIYTSRIAMQYQKLSILKQSVIRMR